MANYIVNAPNGREVTVSHAYGSKTFRQGEITDNEQLSILFPQIFLPIAEPVAETVVAPVVEPAPVKREGPVVTVREIDSSATEPEQKEPVIVEDLSAKLAETPKKRAGRPAGAKNKPKSSVKKPKKA